MTKFSKIFEIKKFKHVLYCSNQNAHTTILGDSKEKRNSFNSLLKVRKLVLLIRARGREFHKFVEWHKKVHRPEADL